MGHSHKPRGVDLFSRLSLGISPTSWAQRESLPLIWTRGEAQARGKGKLHDNDQIKFVKIKFVDANFDTALVYSLGYFVSLKKIRKTFETIGKIQKLASNNKI